MLPQTFAYIHDICHDIFLSHKWVCWMIFQPFDDFDDSHFRRIQSLFATGIERGIQDHQVLKYQPSVTPRVIFYHLIPSIIIKY